ncbi:uncharacterized protein [Linepithema humile]|uniref:uncharacterized protein n=1 Tax=Linepithema humile TaxID=83485 RepID=UPI00351EA06D
MDADDEKRINEQLALIRNNEKTITHITQNQLKVLNTTIAHIGDVEETIEQNNKRLYNLDARIWNGTLLVIKSEEINEYYTIISRMLTDLQRDVQDAYDFITYAGHGMLNPRVTPTEQILNELRAITPKLPQGTHFPFVLENSGWHLMEQVVTVTAFVANNTVYCIIKFPLVSYPRYKLIKVIPLPIFNHGTLFTFTEVNQHIIAVNLELASYVTLSEQNVDKCKIIGKQYICKSNSPVYNINQRALCEVQLYAKLAKKNTCDIRFIRSNQTIWIALNTENAWLYSANKEQEITIQCENRENVQVVISRTGRIILTKNCKIITTDMTIKAFSKMRDTSIQAFLPQFNLTLIKETATKKDNKIIIRPIKLKKIIQNPSELMELGEKAKDIYNELKDSETIQFNKPTFIYPMVTSSVAVIIIIISVTIGVIIVLIKKRNKKLKT